MSEEESSVLFSLKELMTIEEDRIKTEEEDRKRAEEDAERARLEAAASARAAEEARQRAEEERRRAEEQRRREEQARLEAIEKAELEKARTEAEQRARMEAMRAQQDHEVKLKALETDEGKKKLKNVAIGLGVLVFVVGGSVGGFGYYRSVQADKREAQLIAEQERVKEEARKNKAQLEAKQQEISDLVSKLAAAPTQEEKQRLEAELKKARTEESGLQKKGATYRRNTSGAAKKAPAPAPARKCRPGDPLCSDI